MPVDSIADHWCSRTSFARERKCWMFQSSIINFRVHAHTHGRCDFLMLVFNFIYQLSLTLEPRRLSRYYFVTGRANNFTTHTILCSIHYVLHLHNRETAGYILLFNFADPPHSDEKDVSEIKNTTLCHTKSRLRTLSQKLALSLPYRVNLKEIYMSILSNFNIYLFDLAYMKK